MKISSKFFRAVRLLNMSAICSITRSRSKGAATSSNRSASTFEKSRMSLITAKRFLEAVCTLLR